MKFTRFLTISLAVLTLALAAIIPNIAQEEAPIAVEDITFAVCGAIEFAGDDILVNGVVIAPAGAFNPSAFTDGDAIAITGHMLNDDTLQATGYEVLEDVAACDTDNEEGTEDSTDVLDETIEDGEDTTTDVATEEDDICAEDEASTTEEAEDACDAGGHPVAVILADEFDLDLDVVEGWHAEGFGYGEIARILLIADQLEDIDADDLFGLRESGQGWGTIMRALDVHPSQIAPGRVISGRYNADAENVARIRGNRNGNRNGNGNGRGNRNGNRNGNGGGRGSS